MVRSSVVYSTVTVTVAPGVPARFTPVSYVANTAGIVSPVASPIMPTSPVRPGWPSFMITTPAAPAACALSAFTLKPQVPRWSSAIEPAAKPGEVRGLTAAGVGADRRGRVEHQTDRDQGAGGGALGRAGVEGVAQEVLLVDELGGVGADPDQLGVLLEVVEGELLDRGPVARAPQLLDDVLDGGLVARPPGRAVAVLVGDALEGAEVLEHALDRDGLGELDRGSALRD